MATVARILKWLEENGQKPKKVPPPAKKDQSTARRAFDRIPDAIAEQAPKIFDAYEQQQQLAKIALTQVQEQWKHHGTEKFNSGKLTEAIRLADKLLTNLMPYCKPRLSAMLVGGQVVTKIEVTGGMRDEWANPPNVVEFPAGTVIEADEEIGSSSEELE